MVNKMVNESVKEWLSEYRNSDSRVQMERRLRLFLQEVNLSIDQLIGMEAKDAKHLIKKYVADQQEKGTLVNTIMSRITAPRSFLVFLGKEITFKRSDLPKLESAHDKHVFSNGDLAKLFDCADVRGKAIISLGVSLGWAISDVLALDRKFIETLISRAKDENEQFIFFNKQRIKTSEKAFGIINSLALEWVSKWLAINKGEKLFDISENMINIELQRLAKEAQLKLIGKVSFHCFRAWTFNSLIKAGFSEFESKLIVGKSIPLSDSTYLTLEEHIKEVYPQKYDRYLNIKPSENGESQKKFLVVQENLEKENAILKDRLDGLQKNLLDLDSKVGKFGVIINTWLEIDKWKKYSDVEKESIREYLGLKENPEITRFYKEVKPLLDEEANSNPEEFEKQKARIRKKT